MGESGGGTWVAAADGGGGEGKAGREGSAGPAGGRGGSRERSAPPEDGVGITGERAVGRGLAGALGLLQDKGALKPGVEWSGRNTDRSKNALQVGGGCGRRGWEAGVGVGSGDGGGGRGWGWGAG